MKSFIDRSRLEVLAFAAVLILGLPAAILISRALAG